MVASRRRRATSDRRGSISTMMALIAVPLVIALGASVDMSRLVLAKAALQHAADSAALAGATAYQSDQLTGAALAAANNYFDSSTQGLDATVSSRSITSGPGQASGGAPSLNVTVDATATMPTTLMAMANVSSMTITAHAVAANPVAQPVVTLGPVGSTAYDWNSAYMYGVPNGLNGQPDYTKFPPFSQFWEVGSNCNRNNSQWTSESRCNGQFGAIVPSSQTFPKVSASQPLAFLFVNMNNGEIAPDSQGYGPNQYGAAPGNIELLTSATMSLNQPPSQNTDNSAALFYTLKGLLLNQASTEYSDLNGTARPNCAIQIQQVDPNHLPHDPPYPGQCFSTSDPRSGWQYANLSCAQMAGRTFMYWWNDMGGSRDDYDYKNLYFTIRCVAGAVNPNGGILYATAPLIGLPVALVQ